MALQPLNFGRTTVKTSFIPSLLAGAITFGCGVTASFLSPSNGVSAALAGSTIGATGVTIFRKRQEDISRAQILQDVRYIVETQLESHLSSINHDFAALNRQVNQLQTEIKAGAKNQVTSAAKKIAADVTQDESQISQKESTNVADLMTLLNSRNVKIQGYNQPIHADDLLDNLAMTLGEQYAILEPLHHQIIKSLQTGKKFSLNLANSSQKVVGIYTSFCQSLHGKSLLDSYHYDKKQKIIYALPQIGNAEITQFLIGGWFERFVYKKVANFLTSQGLEYEYLRNPHVILQNQDKFELDLLFLVNHELLWIECKSGQQSNSCLKSYCERRQALGVPKERALLVSLKLSDEQTAHWTELWDLTVVNSNNFLNRIAQALKLSDNFAKQDTQPLVIHHPGELAKLLNKKSLRPLPENRQDIIRELMKILADLNEPMTMAQAEKKVAEALEISNSKVHDILNAVIRSRCLLDEKGEIVSSFVTPVSALCSEEYAVLAEKCVQVYASVALSLDINYFQHPENVCEFEQTIGAQVPEAEIITQLRANILDADNHSL